MFFSEEMMNSNPATSMKMEKEMNENSPQRWRNFATENFRRNCGFSLRLRALGNLQSEQGARRREILNARVCAGGRTGASPMSNATMRRQRAVCSERQRGGPEEDGGEPRH
jgi:hypothetical protein